MVQWFQLNLIQRPSTERKRSKTLMENSSSASARNNQDSLGGDQMESSNAYDRLLPIANLSRIMKNSLKDKTGKKCHYKVAKDARSLVQECVSEFISFITSDAAEKCKRENRKAVTSEDILEALNNFGFDGYVPILEDYITKYREINKD